MEIPEKLKEQIEKICSDDEELKKKLLALDPEAIKTLAQMSQRMDPRKVIEDYESGNIKAIYDDAKKKVEALEIYNYLCAIYSHNSAKEARIKRIEKEIRLWER